MPFTILRFTELQQFVFDSVVVAALNREIIEVLSFCAMREKEKAEVADIENCAFP